MVKCYLCGKKLRVTRDKHVYDEKLKKRYHFKCFAGICRECDMPVYTKSKHKVVGSNVWHEECYKRAHAKRENPVETIEDASWKAMVAARKAAGVPKKLWRKFEEDWFMKHPPEFEKEKPRRPTRRVCAFCGKPIRGEGFYNISWGDFCDESHFMQFKEQMKKNPRRPTKEFWDKHYPEVLAQYKKKYPKKEAEERARKATAAIWYQTMGPKKKAEYEAIRRRREARENPPWYDPELRRSLKRDLAKAIEDMKCLLVPTEGRDVTVMAEFMSLKPAPVQEGLYSVEDTPENRRALDRLGMTYTPYKMPKADIDRLMYQIFSLAKKPAHWVTKWVCPVHGVVPEHMVYGEELGPKYHEGCGQQVTETEVRVSKNPTLVTPEQETDIADAFRRVIEGVGTEADKALVRLAREADVIMSTGPSVMLRRNPDDGDEEGVEDEKERKKVEKYVDGLVTKYKELYGEKPAPDMSLQAIEDAIKAKLPKPYKLNPEPRRLDYIIQDEFGKVYETGTATREEANARALVLNRKYMRKFEVIYPKAESPEVKKAAQKATEALLKS